MFTVHVTLLSDGFGATDSYRASRNDRISTVLLVLILVERWRRWLLIMIFPMCVTHDKLLLFYCGYLVLFICNIFKLSLLQLLRHTSCL